MNARRERSTGGDEPRYRQRRCRQQRFTRPVRLTTAIRPTEEQHENGSQASDNAQHGDTPSLLATHCGSTSASGTLQQAGLFSVSWGTRVPCQEVRVIYRLAPVV